MSASETILKDFGLNVSELSLLASLQLHLVDADIEATTRTVLVGDNSAELKSKKRKWRERWVDLVLKGFAEMSTDEKPALWSRDSNEFEHETKRLRGLSDRVRSGILLLELVAWDAYWPFEKNEKTFRGLQLCRKEHDRLLERTSEALGFPAGRAKELRKSLEKAHKALSGYWFKVAIGIVAGLGIGALTLGIAAPFIAGAVGGAMGLGGAAAVNAGLAAIGGGAVAAGGFGMTGGMVVLVGGGALLGLGAGGIAGTTIANLTAVSILLSAAKLEVVLREFILQGQRDTAKAQSFLVAQRDAIQALEREIDALRFAGTKSDERVKELERALHILEGALRRNQGIVNG